MQDWQLKPARDIGLPLGGQMSSVRREAGLVNAATHLVWFSLTSVYLKLVHRLAIEGGANLPKSGSFVLAANHASHLDALVLASAVNWRLQSRVFPVAAGDTFFSTRLTGILSALLINALPMWRRQACSHGLSDLRQRLTQDRCVFIVFPEGTRSRTGELGPFRAGVGMLVAGTDVPVVPCRLAGTYEAWPHDARWPRFTKLRLKIGEPIGFSEVANNREGWQTVARTVEETVLSL
jgi:1-acyl-sn-glycerol-3-phosphate acyltransferase